MNTKDTASDHRQRVSRFYAFKSRAEALRYLASIPADEKLELASKGNETTLNRAECALQSVVGSGPEWFCKRTRKSDWTAGELLAHCQALFDNSVPTRSPWGGIQTVEHIAPGIVRVGTASHGGIHLERQLNAQVPAYMRGENGWYEEDCQWAVVTTVFPQHFSTEWIESAKSTLKNWDYEAYEKFYNVTLKPGESHEKDQRLFYDKHAGDLLCVSAINSERYPGFVEVTAEKGGPSYFRSILARSGETTVEKPRLFFVEEKEYKRRGPFAFIVDPNRHVAKEELHQIEGAHPYVFCYRRPGDVIATEILRATDKVEALRQANDIIRTKTADGQLVGLRVLSPMESAASKRGELPQLSHENFFPDLENDTRQTTQTV